MLPEKERMKYRKIVPASGSGCLILLGILILVWKTFSVKGVLAGYLQQDTERWICRYLAPVLSGEIDSAGMDVDAGIRFLVPILGEEFWEGAENKEIKAVWAGEGDKGEEKIFEEEKGRMPDREQEDDGKQGMVQKTDGCADLPEDIWELMKEEQLAAGGRLTASGEEFAAGGETSGDTVFFEEGRERSGDGDTAGWEQDSAEEKEPLTEGEKPAETLSLEEQSVKRYSDFVPHEKVREVGKEEMTGFDILVKNFYTIDPTTMAGTNQLSATEFLAKDMTISKEGDGPKILIYHTHSQEGFADSVAGDSDTTIVGVGEELTRILTEDYGYQVLHHTGEYDKKTRDNAYSRALPEIEQILEENPSIQVVIDLHRDEMPEGTRLVTEVDGKPTAKFMFFNGLSRTRQTGDLDYLYNVYLEDNLAFSFQLQLKAMEYYPGLTRKIYLKGYRYNMHLCPKSLLIELGAQNNTIEEAMNACGPLAHLLDLVLSGEGT